MPQAATEPGQPGQVDTSATDAVCPGNSAPADNPGRSCASCGKSLADRHALTRYCDDRCKKRSQRGMPAVAPRRARWTVPLAHPQYSVERCPGCDFPEADGGACGNCGWTLPRPGTVGGRSLHPAGSLSGPTDGPHARGRELAAAAASTREQATKPRGVTIAAAAAA
jgi:hypothetical protein